MSLYLLYLPKNQGVSVWHQWRKAGLAGRLQLPETWLAFVFAGMLLIRFVRYVVRTIGETKRLRRETL